MLAYKAPVCQKTSEAPVVTGSRRIIKIGTWVRHDMQFYALYTKHSQGQKVKGQGHEVMRRSSTKTSNISSNVTR